MARIVCFGEIMLRLNPEGYLRFLQADKFEATYAGSEANVAVELANFGNETTFVTKVPSNDIGQSAVNELRRYGVDISHIVRGGPRLGIYFVEKGASQRPSKVIYDRAGSSIALAQRSEFDWDEIFRDVDWFHFTGISPALGGENPQICLDACRTAKEMGLKISCDLNYRGSLWTKEEANKVMTKLMPFVDVCIANEEDAADVFGISAENSDIMNGKLDQQGYISVARQLTEQFGFDAVAITLRGSISASDNMWSGMLYYRGTSYFSPEYKVHIVDRVGGGDSFSGALIHALLNYSSGQEIVDFAVAASCLKHTIEHDLNLINENEASSLASGIATGRVQR